MYRLPAVTSRGAGEGELLRLIKSVKYLSHKYDKDTKYQHVAYHTLLRHFMLFQQGDCINLDYKQIFKKQIEVLEAYNGGVLFGNSPKPTARDITILELNAETKGGLDKAHILARGKYLSTMLLLSLYRRLYGELILSLKNEYSKQQRNYLRTLTNMYGLMVRLIPRGQHRWLEGATKA